MNRIHAEVHCTFTTILSTQAECRVPTHSEAAGEQSEVHERRRCLTAVSLRFLGRRIQLLC